MFHKITECMKIRDCFSFLSPVDARAASLHVLLRVFSGAAPSGPRSHLANTDTGCAFAPLRFASAAPGHGSLQALSNAAYRQAFITRPPPHPRHR